jgi:hypothetical protein
VTDDDDDDKCIYDRTVNFKVNGLDKKNQNLKCAKLTYVNRETKCLTKLVKVTVI